LTKYAKAVGATSSEDFSGSIQCLLSVVIHPYTACPFNFDNFETGSTWQCKDMTSTFVRCWRRPLRVDVIVEKPRIVESPKDIIAKENTNVIFHCRATGDPEPTVIWKKLRGKITADR